MICKNCQNEIKSGTYCLRCGTENDESIKNIQIEEVNETPKKKNSILRGAVIIAIIWLAVLITLGLIKSNMDASYNSCIAVKGHSECGLGTLCDSECFPPFYIIVSTASTLLHILSITTLPGFLLIALIINYAHEKNKKTPSK